MNWIQATLLVALLLGCMLDGADVARAGPPATQSSGVGQSTAIPKSAVPPANDLTNLSLEDLMNVEVTSVSKEKQNIADAPAAITVISQDDIRRSGFSTIPDLLRLAPGMDVGHINSSSWAISSRGLNGQFANNLLVLQDGRTLYVPIFAGVYWNTVDYLLPDLDRIEVIRGPGATLWGANAVNGVINIISKEAKDTQGVLIDTRFSFNGEDDTGFRYGGQLDKETYYRVYGKASYTNEFPPVDTDDGGDDWESYKGGFRIDRYTSENDTFTLQGDMGSTRQRLTEPTPTFTPPFTIDRYQRPVDVTGNMLGRWTHRVDETSDYSVQVYYDYLNLEDDGAYTQHTFDLDFHDRFMLGTRNEITWGLGYRFINAEAEPTQITSFDSPKNNSIYSAFLQDMIILEPEHWFLTLGSKFEHNDYTGVEIQPSARLMWTPNNHNTFWGAISRAVRTPSRVENDINTVASRFQQPTAGGGTVPAEVQLVGNTDAKSEEMVAYELGYRMQPIKQVSFDIAMFYNNYSRMSSDESLPVQPGSPLIIPLQADNRVHGDTWGTEISSTLDVTPEWRLSGSYSLLEAAFNNDPGSTDTTSAANDQESAPKNQFQIHSAWDVTKNVQFNSAIYYVGRVPEFDIPAYFSTNLNVIWQIKAGMSLQVGVQNLFDERHPEYGITGGQGVSGETPRTVYAELSYKF